MCGIAGILEFEKGTHADAQVLGRMCATMVHRGPDDDGTYVQGSVALGIRRLSIIDLATGNQPISNENGSIWVVFNGEIYNHLPLRQRLIAEGHRFRTHSDTETIVHLYEEYGHDCVRHLRGMFAFAIWDGRKRLLFVARDRLGIKPFYYYVSPEHFIFGSEIKVLLAHPDVHPDFDRAVLPEYLTFGFLNGEKTFYRGIKKLMPGCWLEIAESGELRSQQYWDLPAGAEEESVHDERYYLRTYRNLLENAVESHLMSDVPLGVFLSGGLDSSTVAAIATCMRRSPIQTFSVGYPEQTYSELSAARIVAQHLNSIHHEVVVTEEDFFGALPLLIWHEDEPIAWPSSVPLYFLARSARDQVKVVLTGEGSDETLAGYGRYALTLKNAAFYKAYRHLPQPLRRQMQQFISGSDWIGAPLRRRLSHTFLAKDGECLVSHYLENFLCAFSENEQAELLNEAVAKEYEKGASYQNALSSWENSSGDMLHRLLYTDIKTYLVELLMKQDNMSMAASIESRVPFLDHTLVEFAMRIPKKLLVNGLAGKSILKRAVGDLLPPSIVNRRKLGFPTPWEGWLRGRRLDSIQELLLEKRSTERCLFKPGAVKQIFTEHRAQVRDNYERIWRLLNLELWHRVCLERDSFGAMLPTAVIEAGL